MAHFNPDLLRMLSELRPNINLSSRRTQQPQQQQHPKAAIPESSSSTSNPTSYSPPIPFHRFIELIESLQALKLKIKNQRTNPNGTVTPTSIFRTWLTSLGHGTDKPLPPGSGRALWKLLYPDEEVTRRYGLTPASLAAALGDEQMFDLGDRTKLWTKGWNAASKFRGKGLERERKKQRKSDSRRENGESMETESTVSGHRGLGGLQKSECLGYDVYRDKKVSTVSSNNQQRKYHSPWRLSPGKYGRMRQGWTCSQKMGPRTSSRPYF